MQGDRTAPSLTLALLAATFLTPPDLVQAAPGDSLGGEFQVNTFTTGGQVEPVVAMDADGDFVVAWTDRGGQEGPYGYYGIFAQRYNAAGVPQGPEFQVNTSTIWKQLEPDVAMDADGDFVVAWTDDYGGRGVFAQRFDAGGVAQGPEFEVNTSTGPGQRSPAVAMNADGDFVVAWEGPFGSYGIFAQRFDAAGVAQGPEIRVNTVTTGKQRWPAIAMDADGDFVVAWTSYGQDDPAELYDMGVFAQRFDAAGVAQGPEFQVNTFTTRSQAHPSVAMDADGDFVVAWTSYLSQDGSGKGVFAQRYDASGVPKGPEFQANSFATSNQERPSVAMDADGDFVVAWDSYGQDGNSTGIFARRFDAAGVPQGPEFQVNAVTQGGQTGPSVAADADGDFVVAWWGVYARRFDGAERVEGDFDGDGNGDVLWRNTATGTAVVWLMEGAERRAAQSIGTVPVVWQVDGTGDFNGDGKADILWRHTGNGSAVIWQMDGLTKAASAAIGKPPLDWVVEQLRDTDGDGNSDIFWRNTTTKATLVWRMSGFTKTIVGSPGGAGAEWQVQ